MRTRAMIMALLAVVLLGGCKSKKASADYYNNPGGRVAGHVTETKREAREVDRMAAEKKDRLRAVGMGNDVDEKYARREALRDGQAVLAGYLETAIVTITTEYHKKATANAKKFAETNMEEYVETNVAQKIGTKLVGQPEVYDRSDGTVSVYVCVELTKTTDQILDQLYEQMTQDEVLGTDYDKKKFIEDNKKRLEELRKKVD